MPQIQIIDAEENVEIYNGKYDHEEACPVIECTKDYDVFKTMQGNRNVSENHVRNLMIFIQRKNLLKLNPILVNENFEVVDGQHRLEAAKLLNKHIFYIIEPGLSYRDAGILNACSDDFEFKEYLDLYLKNGVEEYIRLADFQNKHNITIKRFRYLISTEQRQIFDRDFKIGMFKIIDDLDQISNEISKIEEVISFLGNLLLANDIKFIYSDHFWRALYLFLKKDIDMNRLKEKFSCKYQSFRQMSTYKDYLKLFVDIYNWKAKVRVK